MKQKLTILFTSLILMAILISSCATSSGYGKDKPDTTNTLINGIEIENADIYHYGLRYYHDTERKVGIWIMVAEEGVSISVVPDAQYLK